tara:strand:+ start:1269 stop:1508 length:240 start_codon:yes stop_codon:yes gene_type:complete
MTAGAFLCGLSCGTILVQNLNHDEESYSAGCINEESFIIEKESVITIAPGDICSIYNKELTFEENILNCSSRRPILFNI